MEWELRIILGVLGAAVVGYVAYDGWRRSQKGKQKSSIPEMRNSRDVSEARDNGGFDMDGIGEVRVKKLGERESDFATNHQTENSATESLVATRDDPITVTSQQDSFSAMEEEPVDPDVEPELIFSVTLLAPEEGFAGEKLLQLLIERGCRFGDMNIFHRYKSPQATNKKYFSIANAFEPGTFDVQTMANETFKGISFFMGVPGSYEPDTAYQTMVDTARALKDEFGGKLMDSSRSVFTDQTRQHELEQIKEYKRRQLTQS
ncbi:cell division protein ZipA [Pleionea sediminis]|uniref:cell division protein ZipA n=1 Tax=Pleionea sediminis TaxID=2569479 RepID=UPI001185899F|nr:cell division protein ZipA [Pleionea sediminis]